MVYYCWFDAPKGLSWPSLKNIIPARDPEGWGAKGDETSGGGDDDKDTQMRAHMREQTYESA